MDKEPEIIDAEVIETNGASNFQKGLAVFFAIVTLLYTISPIDLAPDAIPVFGWVDDLGLLATATMNVVQQFAKDQIFAQIRLKFRCCDRHGSSLLSVRLVYIFRAILSTFRSKFSMIRTEGWMTAY